MIITASPILPLECIPKILGNSFPPAFFLTHPSGLSLYLTSTEAPADLNLHWASSRYVRLNIMTQYSVL